MVMHAVTNSLICRTSDQIGGFGCDDMAAADRQLQAAKDMEAFIDAQAVGQGRGWHRIVYTPQEARDSFLRVSWRSYWGSRWTPYPGAP